MSCYRNSGIETTLLSLHRAFHTFQMVVAVPGPLSTFGGGAGNGEGDWSSSRGSSRAWAPDGLGTAGGGRQGGAVVGSCFN